MLLRLTFQVQHFHGEYFDDYLLPFKLKRTSSYYQVKTAEQDVDNWSEHQEAGRVAFCTDGVWAVDNRLTVNGYDYQWDEWLDRNIPEQYDLYYYPDYTLY